jgi:hypothetical protein
MSNGTRARLTNPGQILGLSSAYWRSCTLHAAVRLDLFTEIGDQTVSGEDIAQTVHALDPDGLVLIHEFILDDAGTSPAFPALFSLNMLLGTNGGRSYTRGELEGMLSEAGVRDLHRLEFVGPTESRILAGRV